MPTDNAFRKAIGSARTLGQPMPSSGSIHAFRFAQIAIEAACAAIADPNAFGSGIQSKDLAL